MKFWKEIGNSLGESLGKGFTTGLLKGFSNNQNAAAALQGYDDLTFEGADMPMGISAITSAMTNNMFSNSKYTSTTELSNSNRTTYRMRQGAKTYSPEDTESFNEYLLEKNDKFSNNLRQWYYTGNTVKVEKLEDTQISRETNKSITEEDFTDHKVSNNDNGFDIELYTTILKSDEEDKYNLKNNTSKLSTHIHLPVWGYDNYINERNVWLKGLHSPYEEPGFFYFKIFFDFNTLDGLLGGILNTALNTSAGRNSAAKYFDYCIRSKRYKTDLINARKEALLKFIKILSYINTNAPWFFQSISGLGDANSIILNEINKKRKLEITCLEEAIDMRLSTLLDLYRFACYDDVRNREILPENLRKFDINVLIFHVPIKRLHTAFVHKKSTYDYKTTAYVRAQDAAHQLQEANKGNSEPTGNLESPFNTIMSYKLFCFQNCEIDLSSLTSPYNNEFTNKEPHTINSTRLTISYDKCLVYNSNEFYRILFGSTGFLYSEYNNSPSEMPSRLVALLEQSAITDRTAKIDPFKNEPLTIEAAEAISHNNLFALSGKGLGNIYGEDMTVGSKYWFDKAKYLSSGSTYARYFQENNESWVDKWMKDWNLDKYANNIRIAKNGMVVNKMMNGYENHHVGSDYWLEKTQAAFSNNSSNIYNKDLINASGKHKKLSEDINDLRERYASIYSNINNNDISEEERRSLSQMTQSELSKRNKRISKLLTGQESSVYTDANERRRLANAEDIKNRYGSTYWNERGNQNSTLTQEQLNNLSFAELSKRNIILSNLNSNIKSLDYNTQLSNLYDINKKFGDDYKLEREANLSAFGTYVQSISKLSNNNTHHNPTLNNNNDTTTNSENSKDNFDNNPTLDNNDTTTTNSEKSKDNLDNKPTLDIDISNNTTPTNSEKSKDNFDNNSTLNNNNTTTTNSEKSKDNFDNNSTLGGKYDNITQDKIDKLEDKFNNGNLTTHELTGKGGGSFNVNDETFLHPHNTDIDDTNYNIEHQTALGKTTDTLTSRIKSRLSLKNQIQNNENKNKLNNNITDYTKLKRDKIEKFEDIFNVDKIENDNELVGKRKKDKQIDLGVRHYNDK